MSHLALSLFLLLPLSSSVALASSASLRVDPPTLKPGDPAVVTVLGVHSLPEGELAGRPLHFYAIEGGFEAISGLPVETTPGTVSVEVTASPKDTSGPLTLDIEVLAPGYPSRELTVAKGFIQPAPATRRKIRADQAAFREAFAQPFGPRRFTGPFTLPRSSKVTAPFGDLRTFNGKKQSQHYGLDLDGRVGDAIHAGQAGRVVLARECYASGNTVLVSHGAGLFTAYFHMSEFAVQAGDAVTQGQLLGRVGRTGRVTGPHLHWAVKVDALYVDPQVLLKLPFSARVLPGADQRAPATAAEDTEPIE